MTTPYFLSSSLAQFTSWYQCFDGFLMPIGKGFEKHPILIIACSCQTAHFNETIGDTTKSRKDYSKMFPGSIFMLENIYYLLNPFRTCNGGTAKFLDFHIAVRVCCQAVLSPFRSKGKNMS